MDVGAQMTNYEEELPRGDFHEVVAYLESLGKVWVQLGTYSVTHRRLEIAFWSRSGDGTFPKVVVCYGCSYIQAATDAACALTAVRIDCDGNEKYEILDKDKTFLIRCDVLYLNDSWLERRKREIGWTQ